MFFGWGFRWYSSHHPEGSIGIRLVLETAHILVAEARIDHLLHDHFLLNDPEIPEKCTAVPRNGQDNVIYGTGIMDYK